MANHKLTYALRDGRTIAISDVESGLKCGCICPSCGEALVARKGDKRVHHFAHHSGSSCEYGYETSLHLAAKEILASAKKMVVPPVVLKFTSYKDHEVISEAKEITIDRVELEQHFDGLIPDVVVYAGDERLFVEIFVTHPVTDEKLEKIKEANISTIEINLSKKRDVITPEELKELLLGDSPEKEWKYHVVAQDYLQRFFDVSLKIDSTTRHLTYYDVYCPRLAKGVYWMCRQCEYCVGMDEKQVFCTGKHRISTIKDLEEFEELQRHENASQTEPSRVRALSAGMCPDCGGGKLVEREGQYGPFLGCSNYPECEFRTSTCPICGGKLVKRDGKHGPFWGCSNFPNCTFTSPIVCPLCGRKLVERSGPYGSFWGCSNFPECKFTAKKG